MCLLSERAGYIGEFEIVDDHRGGKIVIEVSGVAGGGGGGGWVPHGLTCARMGSWGDD